ncbi:MAG: LptF/LptG family permease [Deltaproteobacteria bacterium]|nr:LptF/LptG family permease [Deltaproteobacteria bacterium]
MEAFPVLRARLLERYLAREFAKLLLFCLAAFLSIFLVVDFFERIDRLVSAGLGVGGFVHYSLLKTPFALSQVLAPAVLLSAILAFGLLARFHEIMAIRTSGLDILRLLRPVLLLVCLVALAGLALNLYLVPWSRSRLSIFWETQVEKKPPRSLVSLEHFWYKGDRAIYNIVLFKKDSQTLEGVRVYLFDSQFRLTALITAKQACWQGNSWRFRDGFLQTFEKGAPKVWVHFEERDFALTEKPQDFTSLERKVEEMDFRELWHYTKRLERDGYKATLYQVEIQTRFSLALVPFNLAMLGLGLALRRGSLYLPALVAVGLGLMFIYWLVFGLSVSLGQAGRWPVLWSVWWPHGLFALLGGGLLSRASR